MRRRKCVVLLALIILSVTMIVVLPAVGAPADRHLNLVDTYRGIPFQHAEDVALSADGRFLYASHFLTGLSVLGRSAAEERFEMLASYFRRGGGEVFEGVHDFTLSPDESHAYVLGIESHAVAVLARDPLTGLLSQVQTLVPGESGLPAFTDPSSLVVSPLGDFAYLAVRNPEALRLLVLARDPATGRLSFIEDFIAPETYVHTSRTSELLLSPGGEHLYSLGAPVAAVFERDPASGRLTFIEAFDSFSDGNESLVSTYDGAISPDGSTLYVRGANPCYNSCYVQALAMLRRDPVTGRLEFLGYAPGSVLAGLMPLALSPDGRHLYLPDNESTFRIAIYRRDPGTGALEPTGEYRGQPSSRHGQIYSMTFGDGGQTLYASGFERRPLPRFERDPVSGALSFDPEPVENGEGMVGIADLAAAPDGQLYVAGYLSEAIARFDWDDGVGSLAPRAVSFAREAGMEDLRAPFKLRLAADGRRLFALDDRGVASLARDPAGDLELTGHFDPETVIGSTTGLEVSPDGAQLYLVGYFGTMVLSSELELVQTLEDIAFRDLAAGPEGRFVYGLSHLDCSEFADCRALRVFSRDPESGLLALRDTVSGPGLTPVDEPRSLVVSPDGAHLYVTSIQSGAFSVSAFARNPDGSLEFIEILSDGEPTEEAHFGQEDLAIAPDGRHVYALRVLGNDLAVYERDPESGRLTLLETLTDDDLGSGLTDATSLAVSPDSQRIFVAGGRSAVLTTFSRRCLTESGLCLNRQRFRVDVEWRSFDGTTGSGRVVPVGSDDSGLLWFFDAGNWEMLIKVLDGCGLNDRFWVFAASTTTVEYTLRVTDTLTGIAREYGNPLGTAAAAITDTDAFASCATGVVSSPVADARAAASATRSSRGMKSATSGPTSKSACVPSANRMCLNDGRFSVEVTWHDYAGTAGPGRVADVGSDDSGLFWFFDAGNWEMLIKVLDGCAINERFWLLAASTTDVGYSLRVTDTETQVVREYHNPLGTAAPALVDVFDVCR